MSGVTFSLSSSTCFVTRVLSTELCCVARQSSNTLDDDDITLVSFVGRTTTTFVDVATVTDDAVGDHNNNQCQTARRTGKKRNPLNTSAAAVLLAKQRRRQRRAEALRQFRTHNSLAAKTKQLPLPPAVLKMQARLVANKITVTRELEHAQIQVVAIRETLRRTQMECIGIVESELKYLKRKMEQLEMRTLQAERKYTQTFHSLAKAVEVIHRRAPDELHLIKQSHALDSGSNSQMDLSSASSSSATVDTSRMTPTGSGAGSRVGLRQL